MLNLVDWLLKVDGYRFVPLFDADKKLIVRTKDLIAQTKHHGLQPRRLLLRSPQMEAAVIDLVEAGLEQDDWEGLLYVMGWGAGLEFRPLYVGKAERRGKKHELSMNLRNIKTSRRAFARWGDEVDYHIGDLSQSMFGFKAYRPPRPKHGRWAKAIFETFEPPKLRQPVNFFVAPWSVESRGPSGLSGSVAAVEKEVIALASVQFADCLLNVDGV